ncbi:MAG: hypothetical protein RIS92_1574 [Verrucomicrobiota bacterium]|jgi:hypothetical protein
MFGFLREADKEEFDEEFMMGVWDLEGFRVRW